MQNYIRLHCSEIIDNTVIADYFGYSPIYLCDIFKKETGITLHKALILERIALAKKYLTRTDISIEEIASVTAFSFRAHFCKAFKKYTDKTPMEYRKARKNH